MPLRGNMQRLLLNIVLALAGLVALSAPARAECWQSSTENMAFGEVSQSEVVTSSATFTYICDSDGTPTYYTFCASATAGDSGFSGVSPRYLKNPSGGPTSNYLPFNLYSDPARTQILGPDGDSSYSAYSWNMLVQTPSDPSDPDHYYIQKSGQFTIYGKVPPYTMGISAGNYFNYMNGVALRYRSSKSGYPASCSGAGSSKLSMYMLVSASVPKTCLIISASNLDFGLLTSLDSPHDSTSSIQLQCPMYTSFQVSLSNGQHALGSQRRMSNGGGHHVLYDLYKDSARTRRWGQTLNNDTYIASYQETLTGSVTTLTVYGRIPIQSPAWVGTYSDTVLITLTY